MMHFQYQGKWVPLSLDLYSPGTDRAVLQLTVCISTLRGSPQPRPLTKWKHHLCNCVGALCCVSVAMTGEWLGMADRHPHWCRKTYKIISSNVFPPFTIWKPEPWLIFFFPLKVVTWVQLHVRYVWSICNENRGLNTTSHFMQWIP